MSKNYIVTQKAINAMINLTINLSTSLGLENCILIGVDKTGGEEGEVMFPGRGGEGGGGHVPERYVFLLFSTRI